ncbi:flagellar hook-associated protein FlgK [Helicobacter cinaedi PAGU611]|uniref:flagellar hook-associated protein FlgK n=2 Tax=Helicobacter cinaedi TaxID=213 RepID=UPI00025D344A|nr:flagellar hook-associated protein FlgK [Helicobacter cinaedi]BAM12917.1 flagellar hook-associated protein FlgK [Helicobacter cinaedi PAGU611]BBB20793.1 flagellar hook-associated protein FlgK [Helicobacter cinaedi]BDB67253.1 flagellar hook-associated protein FlgK [Helicobacter cinaedi]
MGGILSSLNTSYTGLQAHQLMVDVTGNNISNASDEFYSRQRVLVRPEKPLYFQDYNLGRGVSVETIQRIHDEFVFNRYRKAAEEAQYYDTHFTTLREASAFFPEVDGVGIYNDLEEYFNSWKDLAKNSTDPAQKQVLAKNSQVLSTNIKDTRARLVRLQQKASEELEVTINEVNRIAKEIAHINGKLKEMEDQRELKQANELRDRRDELEYNLQTLVGANVFKNHLDSNASIHPKLADFDDEYVLNIGFGFNIVDGAMYHPIVLKKDDNHLNLNRVYFQGDDFKTVEITDKIVQGKAGSLISLYNSGADGTRVGKIQDYINHLDIFAKGFIEATNSIYSQSAATQIRSDKLDVWSLNALVDSNYNIKEGSFDVVVYSTQGEEIARKTITIDRITTMHDVVKAINENTDDNNDNNALNDVDDYFRAYYDNGTKEFNILSKNPSQGLYVAIQDNGSNFTGAFGLNKFFNGEDAHDIALNQEYAKDATLIRPWLTPVNGNFDVANMMQQLQYDDVDFYVNKYEKKQMRIPEYFQFLAGRVANQTEAAQRTKETKDSVLSAVKKEHLAISQVSLDEEMVNLIKFQGGYAANAKVITTIDRMIETLLGIKQ